MKHTEESIARLKNIGVTKTYSLTAGHTAMVSRLARELTAREGQPVSDGAAVRRAIDLLWEQVYGEAAPALPETEEEAETAQRVRAAVQKVAARASA